MPLSPMLLPHPQEPAPVDLTIGGQVTSRPHATECAEWQVGDIERDFMSPRADSKGTRAAFKVAIIGAPRTKSSTTSKLSPTTCISAIASFSPPSFTISSAPRPTEPGPSTTYASSGRIS